MRAMYVGDNGVGKRLLTMYDHAFPMGKFITIPPTDDSPGAKMCRMKLPGHPHFRVDYLDETGATDTAVGQVLAADAPANPLPEPTLEEVLGDKLDTSSDTELTESELESLIGGGSTGATQTTSAPDETEARTPPEGANDKEMAAFYREELARFGKDAPAKNATVAQLAALYGAAKEEHDFLTGEGDDEEA